jgi:hypothetical protein
VAVALEIGHSISWPVDAGQAMTRWFGFGMRRALRWELVLLLAYTAMIVTCSGFHEFWRDEVRALSLAAEASSPVDVFVRLKNDGHPGLWHLLLYTALSVYRTPLVLRICATGVAVVAAWLFLVHSPFSRGQKALFLLGTFPAYEYSVMARNYGIGMACLFAAAALYPRRHVRPIAFACSVFLLAHTNAYCFLIACAFLGTSLIEQVARITVLRRWYVTVNLRATAVGALLMMTGCVTSALTMMTDDKSIIFRPHEVSIGSFDQWSRAIVTPLRVFAEGFGLQDLHASRYQTWATWLLWLVALALLRRPFVFLLFGLGYTAMGYFASTVYVCVLRHQGNAFLLLLTGLWLVQERERRCPLPFTPLPRLLARTHRQLTSVGATLLLLAQLPGAYEKIRFDHATELSSSKQFGQFIATHPQYRNAIVVAEADHFFEAIPYYAKDVRLYLPREKRFGAYAEFTTRNRDALTLSALLAMAKRLDELYEEPILLGFSFPLAKGGPHRIDMGRRYFAYSAAEFEELSRQTRKIATIRASTATDEIFDLYELTTPQR